MNEGYHQKEMNEITRRSKEDQLQHINQALSTHQGIFPLISHSAPPVKLGQLRKASFFLHKYFKIRFSCIHDSLHCIDIDVSLISDG